MSTRDLLDMALRNLWKRKLRTFLTILGVVIGTTSIVVMISIGIGMNESFQQQLEGWGSLQVIEVYSANSNQYYYGETETTQNPDQSPLDGQMVDIFRGYDHVEAASPIVSVYWQIGSGKYVGSGEIIGLEPEYMEALGYGVEEGRALTAEDTKAIVIGKGVDFYDPKLSWEMQWQSEPPEIELLDTKVDVTYDWSYGTKYADKSIKALKLDVVGLMSAEGNTGWSSIMPLDQVEKMQKEEEKWQTAQGYNNSSSQTKKKKEYDQVLVKVDDINNVKAVQQQILDLGFRAYSLTDELEAMKETTKMLRVVLGAIGAISLVVAAIGITNTMVMAIYERTREIGIMKVIGASIRDIKRLFLTEAAMIGLGGGLLGVLVSFGVSKIVNFFAMNQGSTMTSSIPVWLYVGSVMFATVVGVLSGYFPAKRAMKLSALSAIRTE